ncbi:MAG: thioredoxin family protein, partial [Clostridia bacterium]|nr:thioredoxin family protein [Clostridia bacterium]
ATWCGPCRMMSPIMDELAESTPAVKVGKVNVDDEDELAAKYGIMSIPSILAFKDGALVNQTVGVQPKEAVLALVGL